MEAYVGLEDMASHARLGRTERNAVMFGQPGVAYVYLVYGMYNCLNIVTEREGIPAALLVRAVEPVSGAPAMRQARIDAEAVRVSRRGAAAVDRAGRRLSALAASRLAAGPGLVCAAMSVDRGHNGTDLCRPDSSLRLEPAPDRGEPTEIVAGPRIGIGYASEPWLSRPWRFAVAGSSAVSAPIRSGRPAERARA